MLNAAISQAGTRPAAATAPPSAERMLLVEPNIVARRTITVVIHELGTARVEEAADAQAAARHLQATRYAALLIELGSDPQVALELIGRVRGGQTACARRMPVVAMSAGVDPAVHQRLKALDVQLLTRPFKVRTVLEILREWRLGPA